MAAKQKSRQPPKKVLIVDDDPLVLRILKDKLSDAGYLVTTSSSAFGATQLVEEQRPDVVVIDVMLPALPGNRVAALIRERCGDKCPAIVLYSVKEPDELRALAEECGADDWFTKTDDYDALISKVRALAK